MRARKMSGDRMEGFISNLQRYSTKDGPGIRTTVFCVGCNLRCVWCANPELIDRHVQGMYYKQRCIGCGACARLYPDAIIVTDSDCQIDRSQDLDWQKLVDVCPKDAYEIKGQVVTPQELVNQLIRDKEFYEVSQGGVTFSGGEAGLQASFVKESARLLHQHGIHVALDTAANIPWKDLADLLKEIDLVLLDIKAIDPKIHQHCTGADNALILENARRMADLKKPLWIRLVIVPGWNDDLADIRSRFQFVKSLGDCVERVDVLKLHHLGASKYEQLGLEYRLDPQIQCKQELIQAIQAIAQEEKVEIHIEN